jgi:hypothetical protein
MGYSRPRLTLWAGEIPIYLASFGLYYGKFHVSGNSSGGIYYKLGPLEECDPLTNQRQTLAPHPGSGCTVAAETGKLYAAGTAQDSIRFLKGTASEWGGTHIPCGYSSTIAYARISDKHAENAKRVGEGISSAGSLSGNRSRR